VLALAVPFVALALQGGPAISIEDASVRETNFDTDGLLNVTLSAPSEETVTVHYSMADGTADSTDYVPESGVLTFPPGMTSRQVGVLVKGDALDEPDETVYVDLSDPEHATIARDRGTLTIVDSDGPRREVVAASLVARWSVHLTYTRITRLRVSSAPANSSITTGCAGKGCPFDLRTTGVNITRLYEHARLRPGATVQVTVDAPGQIGKRFRFWIRAGKPPARTVVNLG
jgi:Calx-beta domain